MSNIRKIAIVAGCGVIGQTMFAQVARQAANRGIEVYEASRSQGKTQAIEEQLTQMNRPLAPIEPMDVGDFHREQVAILQNREQRRKKEKYINRPKGKSKFHR